LYTGSWGEKKFKTGKQKVAKGGIRGGAVKKAYREGGGGGKKDFAKRDLFRGGEIENPRKKETCQNYRTTEGKNNELVEGKARKGPAIGNRLGKGGFSGKRNPTGERGDLQNAPEKMRCRPKNEWFGGLGARPQMFAVL